MMPIVLVLAAAVALAWPWIKAHYHEWYVPGWRPDGRHIAAAALVAAALWSYSQQAGTTPTPPAPPAPVGLDLRGKFVGADAARDAALVAALCGELADEIEWDAAQAEPLLKTGVAFDELRIRSRILLCRGESLGEKHPLARDAIEAHLTATAGTSGGPLDAAAKARWVLAYRDVARAAEAAR
jgi:hypothetical protein